jgi:hypothetical protein
VLIILLVFKNSLAIQIKLQLLKAWAHRVVLGQDGV